MFSNGFRPFFLFGAIHAALMVALWVPWYLGYIALPTALAPVDWHMHELLFGYVPAIVAGFLLTAVPNWTGRPPLVGVPLAALAALWLVGRVAVMVSQYLPAAAMIASAMAFPIVLLAVIAREIVASGNTRNLKVLAGLGLLCIAQGLFHGEILAQGHVIYGHHLAIASVLLLIMLIGGRIIPNFTANWIKRNNPGREPAPFGTFDMLAIGLGALALGAWVLLPAFENAAVPTMILLGLAGISHFVRLARWVPHRTTGEPLVLVLHVAYGFVPLGFVLVALGLADGAQPLATGATHAWTVGAIGLMTLAVMTRATRGHSGMQLTAPLGTVVIYLAIVGSATTRLLAAAIPSQSAVLLAATAVLWVAGFATFVMLYGPMLLQAKVRSAGTGAAS